MTTSVSCVCGLIFHNRRDAKNHHRMCLKFKIFNGQERKSKGPYTCEKCGEVLKTIKTYTKHMQKAHSCVKEPHSSYICKVCGKEFTRVTSLLNHEKYVHSTPNVQCPFCDKKVKNKVSLLYHVQTHREILAIYGADPLDLKPVFKLNDIASTQVGEENVLVTFEEMMHQRKDNRQSFKYHCPLCEHKYNSDREMKVMVDIHCVIPYPNMDTSVLVERRDESVVGIKKHCDSILQLAAKPKTLEIYHKCKAIINFCQIS